MVVAAPARPQAADPGRLYRLFLGWTPVLWLLGILAPVGALMLARVGLAAWPRDAMARAVALAWFAVAAAQALSAVATGISIGDPARGFANVFGFGVLGWAFGGLAIAAGAGARLDDLGSVRATARLGLYVLLLGAVAFAAAASGMTSLGFATPVSAVLPESPAVRMYATAQFFQSELTLEALRNRLILFFPYPTALGLAGLCIVLVSLLEPGRAWRYAGVTGGVAAVVFSWSRLAWACLVLGACLVAFLRVPLLLRVVAVAGVAAVAYGAALAGVDIPGALRDLQDQIDSARAGSSMARDLIYERSWEGFLESPVLGNGWIGESVHPTEYLPIGSHSTVYGLLYTGGVVTFGAYVAAIALTTLAAARSYLAAPRGSDRHASATVSLVLVLCLAGYSLYESLFSLTLPCLFLFAFIGAGIATGTVPDGRASEVPAKPANQRPDLHALVDER